MRTFTIGLSVLLVSAGALAFAIGGEGGGGGGGIDPYDPPPPPANTVFAGVLLRLGLGADTLAAAGINAQQASTLAAAVENNYAAATLESRDEAFIAAKRAHDQLRRKVQSGKGTGQDVTALRDSEAALSQAGTARESYLASLRTAALATVTTEQATLVNRIRANSKWHLPVQYLVLDRSEADWVALRSALEEEFPQATQTFLAAADSQSDVATAKVSHDSSIAAVQTAWNSATTE